MEHFVKSPIKILVIGDIMLDHYIYGYCNRISPEAPVPVVEVKTESYTLGGAGNVLKNIISLNCDADIISVIGNDDDGTIALDSLASHGIGTQNTVKDDSRCTTIKSRVLVANHQLIRLDREVTKPISNIIANKLLFALQSSIDKYNIVLLSDYNKGLLTDYFLQKIFNICRETGVKTILDPKGVNFKRYKGVNTIKPNKKEAIAATGIVISDRESLEAACKKIKQQTNCEEVIITMSEDGIACYTDDKLEVIPTKALDVVDVTGAGDTVLASLGVAVSLGKTLFEACNFANHAAAVVVSKVGSATATMSEIQEKSVN